MGSELFSGGSAPSVSNIIGTSDSSSGIASCASSDSHVANIISVEDAQRQTNEALDHLTAMLLAKFTELGAQIEELALENRKLKEELFVSKQENERRTEKTVQSKPDEGGNQTLSVKQTNGGVCVCGGSGQKGVKKLKDLAHNLELAQHELSLLKKDNKKLKEKNKILLKSNEELKEYLKILPSTVQ